MLKNQRIIWDDNGTLTDVSKELNDVYAQDVTFALVAADDKLYIGSDLPFNHRYFLVNTANDEAATVSSVEIWDGSAWQAAVDVVDETLSSGSTLAKSGIIRWVVDRNKSWGQESTTEDIAELATLKIYDLYWVRLTFSANLAAGTKLRYVGHKFSDDNDFKAMYPDLLVSDIKTAFESGKTNWDEQHIAASEAVIKELRRKKLLWSPNQVLDPDQFREASAYKCAEIIYSVFGDDYEDQRKLAGARFYKELDVPNLSLDKNENGKLDDFERRTSAGILRR